MDDLTFTLSESSSGGCQVEAFSTSRIWFVNDDHYCYGGDGGSSDDDNDQM